MNNFSEQQYKLYMQKYEIIEKIGQGAYGVVLKCRCNDVQATKRKFSANTKYVDIVAMKQFKDSDDNQIVKRTTMRQVKVLKMLDHPNIVQLRQAFRKRGFVYLIFQYVKNNLLQVLEKSPDGLDHELIRIIIYQLVKGLAYLHSLNILHRDIKPQNLLISEDNQLKICDFGFARIYKKSNKDALTDYVATRWYRAPELLVGSQYNKQIDMWAVGCILGQLIDGNPMFPGQNQFDQLFLIQKCLGPLIPQHYQTFLKNPRYLGTKFPQINNIQTIDKRYSGKFTPKGLNFLKSLLKMNPHERLTANQALNHPYFEGVQEQQTLRRLSGIYYMRNDSKLSQNNESNSPPVTNSSTNPHAKGSSVLNMQPNESKRHGSIAHQSTMLYETEKQKDKDRQKTEYSNSNLPIQGDNIFKVQKLNIGKKKKEDNFINSKGMNNFTNSTVGNSITNINSNLNSSTTSSTTGSKSLGKSKGSTKPTKQQLKRHISLQKSSNREFQTKTQTGFYILGGSIIPERADEDQESGYISTQHGNNRIYNVRSPKSRTNNRKQTHNMNTQQIMQEQGETGVYESPMGQLPAVVNSLKGQETKYSHGHQGHHSYGNSYSIHGHQHNNKNYNVVPNIIISNSTFNYNNYNKHAY